MKSPLQVQDVNQFLNRWAPPSLAEAWDKIGLQVGTARDPVRGIVVALDVTEESLWETVEHESNLLVTHHPLFFKPIAELTDRTPVMRAARLAAQMGINILSFHTNLDATREGLNDRLAKRLGLKNLKNLIPSRDPRIPRAGLGRVGVIPKTTLGKLLPRVALSLKISHLRYVGDPKHAIRTLAVMTGSGGGFFGEAKAAGADALITGDVKYHAALDALAEGIPLIDIGHFPGEIEMVSLVATKLRQWLKKGKRNIQVHETQAARDPFSFYPAKGK